MLQPALVCFLSVFMVFICPPPADGQAGGGGGRGGGGGAETIQVMFTPTICKVRCIQDRCVNFCERGNVTTLYSNNEATGGRSGSTGGPGFRVFLCPLLCKNGGICLQKDRCLCPKNFTGKFCQIPVTLTVPFDPTPTTTSSSINEIVKPALLTSMAANQELTQSEFLLPLVQGQERGMPGAPSPRMVTVRVEHPPEASVKVHQVLKVSGFSPSFRSLSPSSHSGSAGAPAPPTGGSTGVQAQTIRGGGTYTQYSGFKYCFREVKDGQCSSPLPGLRSKDTCCKGLGKAWGITDCVLCPPTADKGNNSCPVGYEKGNGTQCQDVNECLEAGLCENGLCVNTRGSYSCVCRAGFILDASHGICISHSVISEEKGQCYRVVGSGLGPSSCTLPILRNITKQICCCSRVGKAWGPDCQRCPYFGSVAFKDICPAGPGYHYSASALQFNQRVSEHLGSRGAQLVTPSNQDHSGPGSGSSSSGTSRSQNPSSSSSSSSSGTALSSASGDGPRGSGGSVISRPGPPQAPQVRPETRPAAPPIGAQGIRPHAVLPGGEAPPHLPRPQSPDRGDTVPRPQNPARENAPPTLSRPQSPDRGDTVPRPQSPDRGNAPPTLSRPQSPDRGDTVPRPQSPDRGNAPPTLSRPQSPDRGDPVPRPQSPDRGNAPPTLPRPQSPDRGDTIPRPQSPDRGNAPPTLPRPQSPVRGSRPTGEDPPLQRRPPVTSTVQPTRVQAVPGVCESRPGVCGRGRCMDTPGGKHMCVCDDGFQPNAQRTFCQDVNECTQSPGVCPTGECVNTAGSYRCVCPSGYRSVSQQTGCHDIDECVQNPCRNGRCENTPGSYKCICRHGYKLSRNTCTDVDECAEPLQCPGQECVNTQGSYRCLSCQSGYGLVNRVCKDIDECVQTPCSNGQCENTPGSYRCVCHHGYKLLNNTCTDVDECAEPSQCPGQMCVNTMGSYRCVSCRPGYTLTNRQCTDINECERSDLCPSQECVNTDGSYTCVSCRQGYHTVNGVCTDVDECEVGGACEGGRGCVNTVGSFRCECPPGFRTIGLRRQCTDINECLEGDFCFPKGECVNTDGSYTCVCSHGFTLSANGTACLDVDECSRPGTCVDGRCVNTEGSFHCQCQTGFNTNPEKTACLDVDECTSSTSSVCGSQRCENTIGSFRCLTSCDPGYQVSPSGTCVDVNECSNTTVCGPHAFCQNLIGTYVCVCDQGFTATANGKACEDEDECVSLPDACGTARCHNIQGSFMCECEQPDEEYDNTARKCINHRQSAETIPFSSSSSSSSSSSPSSSFHVSVVEMMLPPLPAARPGELRECYYNLAERGTCSLLATNTTQQECCCTVGEAWGLGCQYHACPPLDTVEFLNLCPSGRGYVSAGPGAFSYRDVDECKRFHPEVCKNGVCVNNIPGYNCYCSSGYVYNNTLLECVDHDECEEESCVGGVCVNTVGSYYCSCPHPLVLDDTQRNCVNSSHLTVDENLSLCWQHVTADLVCQSPLLGAQLTFMDCCCLYGDGWGMECALCPATDSDDYASLCSSVLPPLYPDSYPDSPGPRPGPRAGAPPFFSPFLPSDSFRPPVLPGPDFSPDYDDYSPPGGSRSAFRGRAPPTYSLPEGAYGRPEYSEGYYSEGDYGPADSSRPPSLRLPPDPRAERAFGARPPPPSRPDGAPLSLAPLPGASYEEHEEEEEAAWRPGPPFPPFSDRRGGVGERGGGAGGAPRRVYERRYESYAGLSAAEDCGILHGCENGRCIRVAEGYTCDCYQGYELDMTSMTCIDINECDGAVGLDFPCVNARCVNTDGSFRCICRRGYVLSHRPNHCVAA